MLQPGVYQGHVIQPGAAAAPQAALPGRTHYVDELEPLDGTAVAHEQLDRPTSERGGKQALTGDDVQP